MIFKILVFLFFIVFCVVAKVFYDIAVNLLARMDRIENAFIQKHPNYLLPAIKREDEKII